MRRLLVCLKHEFAQVDDIHFEIIGFDDAMKFKIPRRDIVQIIYNLYNNSLKNFKEYEIKSPEITLKFIQQDENGVSFQFIDNGTGLSYEEFEGFTTLNFDNVASKSFGQGLGLRLTKKIVENNKGVFSHVPGDGGHGTSFMLTFPTY